MTELENILCYAFSDLKFLTQALTHSSFSQDQQTENNERLEFLGDSVLTAIVSDYLFKRYPLSSEGELSRVRAKIISRKNFAKIAQNLELGRFLLLGKGEEKTHGRQKESNLASALEALIGAIFLDSSYETTTEVVGAILKEDIAKGLVVEDYKGRLQEFCQKHYRCKLNYQVAFEDGLAHRKIFSVVVRVKGEVWGEGKGKTKKEAEQQAAQQALQKIETDFPKEA